jgi:hypothetical protein
VPVCPCCAHGSLERCIRRIATSQCAVHDARDNVLFVVHILLCMYCCACFSVHLALGTALRDVHDHYVLCVYRIVIRNKNQREAPFMHPTLHAHGSKYSHTTTTSTPHMHTHTCILARLHTHACTHAYTRSLRRHRA